MNVGDRILTKGDIAVAGGAALAVIASLLPWFTYTSQCVSDGTSACITTSSSSQNGFLGWGFFYMLMAVLSLALFIIRTFADPTLLPRLPLDDLKIYTIAGGVMVVTLVLSFFTTSLYTRSEQAGALGTTYTNTHSWSFGLVVALIGAVILIAGARLKQGDPPPTRRTPPRDSFIPLIDD